MKSGRRDFARGLVLVWVISGLLAVVTQLGFAWELKKVKVGESDLRALKDDVPAISACQLYYYYLLDECAYVTVLGLDVNQTVGANFNMTDQVPWTSPCDTSTCLSLDHIDITVYDVLPPPANQVMNVKVYGADQYGEPIGDLLANRDFEPEYSGGNRFIRCRIDFTNNNSQPGLDLSNCRGNFVVLLTAKNPTGHPMVVLDNISECVDSCSTNPACCSMGTDPYIYPRSTIHTYHYGSEGQWQRGECICDEGGCSTYGCLEAMWKCTFCVFSPSTQPETWGSVKGIYRP